MRINGFRRITTEFRSNNSTLRKPSKFVTKMSTCAFNLNNMDMHCTYDAVCRFSLHVVSWSSSSVSPKKSGKRKTKPNIIEKEICLGVKPDATLC